MHFSLFGVLYYQGFVLDDISNMSLYTFSPIKSQGELFEAIKFIHFSCYELCRNSFGVLLPNSGNMGVFCHYDEEFNYLKSVQSELCEQPKDLNAKYLKLHNPIVISEKDGVPETTYEYLYIRRPDPYRHHVGDLDFYLPETEYLSLKSSMLAGKAVEGARVFDRLDLDMIELFNPDIDALAYVSVRAMTEKVRIKQSDVTKL